MSILQKFRTIAVVSATFFISNAAAQAEVPKVFSPYLKPEQNVKAELVVVLPPTEIQTYINKVKEASKKDPEWFREYSEKSKPGIPLPFDEKLGLTQSEYQKYRELWDKREFKAIQQVGLRLEESDGKWKIRATGEAARLSLLRYLPEDDIMVSTNGKLGRIEDIDAPAESILGAWKGHEWKFEEETALSKVKENFAIGETADKKFVLIVYRLQDITAEGSVLFDRSMVIRFAKPSAK